MLLGIDVSTYFEVLAHGGRFLRGGQPVDPLAEFRRNGVTYSRIRVWADPYDEQGNPYLGGTCDKDNFFALVDKMKPYGYKFMLNFHYSDFWADPSKQFVPKAWRGLDAAQLGVKVYEYTRDFLLECRERGVEVPFIQIGNEITHGLLWPYGQIWEGDKAQKLKNVAYFLSCASRACREVCPESRIIVHVERSNMLEMHREFFDNLRDNGLDYDIIGLSYYPYWHGTFEMLETALVMYKERYGKDIMFVETGYGFTMAPFLENPEEDGLVIGEKFLSGIQWEIPYPLTPDGQEKFVGRILEVAEKHGALGVFYWEPCWVPGSEICWASEAGERYTGEEGLPTVNQWANQCLFDYGGNMLPAFAAFKNKE